MIRRSRALVMLATIVAVAGCYTSQPFTGDVTPLIGSRVELELNDAGRAALGVMMGPEIDRIDGLLLEKDTVGLTVSVKHVFGLRGSVQVWSNEIVRIEDRYIRTFSSRRLSPGRSIAVGVAGVGGFTALITSGVLAGIIGDGNTDLPCDTCGQKILRVVRP